MKRILLVLSIAVMLVFAASPAFGTANEQAPCIADANSDANPGAVGSDSRSQAQDGAGFGTIISGVAQSENPCFRSNPGGPPGKFTP